MSTYVQHARVDDLVQHQGLEERVCELRVRDEQLTRLFWRVHDERLMQITQTQRQPWQF